VAALSGELRERTYAALGVAWRVAKLIFARGRLAYRCPVDNRLEDDDEEWRVTGGERVRRFAWRGPVANADFVGCLTVN
jgi:hypothetical protein